MITTQAVLTCDICGHHRVTDAGLSDICKSWVILGGGKKCLCMRCTNQVLKQTGLRDPFYPSMAQDESEPLREWLKKHAPLTKRSARNGRA